MTPQALNAFADAARQYCIFIETQTEKRAHDFYSRLELLLAHLHVAILPIEADSDAPEAPDSDSKGMSHDQWKMLAQRLEQLTANETNRLYHLHIESWNTANPADNYCAVRASMLWDDLADIYRDIKGGLNLWDINTQDARSEASWKWRTNYEIHWGTHLARATQTIHEIRYRLDAN